MVRLLLLLILAVLGSGCGAINAYLAGSDNTVAPAKLVPIEESIPVQELWSVQVGSGTDGAFIKLRPALSQGQLYAASRNGVVMALNADSGAILWKADTELPISAGVGLSRELVLLGSSDGQVLALRQASGEEAWRIQVSSEVLAPPRAAEGVVVVRTVDGKLTGLDATTGARLWNYAYTVPVLSLRGTAPPLLAQGAVIAGLDTGKLLVLSLNNGTPVWERTIAPPQGRTELERMVDIDSEPRLIGSVLYIAAYQGNITAIDLRNGSTLWTRDFSSHAGLDVDTRRVYFVDDGDGVSALDWRGGGVLWRQQALTGRRLSAPVAGGDHVVVGDFEGYLHWLRKEDGKLVGRMRADKRGIMAAPLAVDRTLYVLGAGGRLSAFRVNS